MGRPTRATRSRRRHTGTISWVKTTLLFVCATTATAYQVPSPDQQPLVVDSNGAAFHSETNLASISGAPKAATVSSPFNDAFRALVADTLAAWHVPGVAIAVVDGDLTWSEGFGTAVYPDKAVTPDTLFYTASTTKAFVAAALALMVDSGNYSVGDGQQKLDWTTPLSTILPDDFVVGSEYAGRGRDTTTDRDHAWATARLTVEDALAHRTGLAGHDPSRSRRYGLAPDSAGRNAAVLDVTRSLRYLPLHTSPRTEWRYCNLMYLVLSHAVETLAGGQWLGDILHDWLWQPLGMSSTFLSLDDARAAPCENVLAQGYYYDTDKDEYVGVPHMPLEEVSGAGGIISSVNDYARWLRCWIDGPAFSSKGSNSSTADVCGGIPFRRSSLDAVLAPKMFLGKSAASPAPFDAPLAYASAWTTSSYKGHRFWGHSGGSNAFGAEVYFFPDDRFGVVLFGNTATTSNMAELILLWHLASERFGIPADERYDWDGQFRRSVKARVARIDGALDRLYPDRAEPPLQPSLPLVDYTGTYHHPAYQNMTIELAGKEGGHKINSRNNYEVAFIAERHDYTWPKLCEFVHVSGEHWLLYTDMLYEHSGNFKSYGRAWFEVGAGGRAHTLVVEFWNADDDTIEGVIPFSRVDDGET
ncbi:serine beta-lactamase-like superfamily protein [Sporothrix brasiliensis 5110]|uniref:Serine beta-lactamase-like superfamily protein n=1 Tax=Sporothrix brasiliensis 5110 TaxID=1398154 RepID=A0A0C2ESU1_9PEZI|nr:serine beta-lactamase-like superfamily protein [Sporothrix brasiliensis 5110]KIH89464.1 serine beta-lactamase-like superfamily protein [Sporothrix brasiliensis 5110]